MTTKTKAVAPELNGAADFNFDHLEIDKATAEFELPWLPGTKDGSPVLIVRPATEANTQFNAAMLKRSGNRIRAANAGVDFNPEEAKEDRKDDRRLYPRYVIVGWRNLVSKDGKLVPFNLDNSIQLVAKLPNWIFDKIRIFCMRPERFVRTLDELEPNAASLAGNS